MLFLLVLSLVADKAQMHVYPETQAGLPVNSTFKDSIYYIQGTTSPALWVWQIEVWFDPTVLRCDSITKGPFANPSGSIWPAAIIKNDTGYVCWGCCLFTNPAVNGNGAICYMFWKVIGDRGSILHMDSAGSFACADDMSDILCDEFDACYKPPAFAIMSPNGGNWLMRGTSTTIKWISSGVSGNVKLELYSWLPFVTNYIIQ